jgi:alpha(1,3/1,4) fucosyltransferase
MTEFARRSPGAGELEVRMALIGFWPSATFGRVTGRLAFMARKYRLVEDQARPQLVVFGPFESAHWTRTMPDSPKLGVPTVFMTGENVEPDMDRCDFAVSFSRRVEHPRHMRMPNWVAKLYMEGANPSDLLCANRAPAVQGSRFCAIVARNPAPNREAMAVALARHGPVDAPSSVFHNTAPIGASWAEKIQFLRNFRFNIAFENACFPGYTTEKLPDTLLAGAIPIYWGDPLVQLDFNTDAFLDLADFESMDELAEEVRRLDRDPEAWLAVRQEPAFLDDRLPDCADEERLFAFWDGVFTEALAAAS